MQDHLRSWALPLIALLACALGGAREPWEQGVVLAAVGGLLFYRPISACAVPVLPWMALASVGWALLAFLPQFLFPLSSAREALQNDYAFPAAWTVTFQPWITWDACILLGAGWLWLMAAIRGGWQAPERRLALNVWCGGVLILLVVSFIAFFLNLGLPGWDSPRHFGPFANRNQMGNLLALGGFFMMVLAHEAHDRHRSFPWFWLLAAVLVFGGLVLNQSRAGIVLFFAAVGLWAVLMIGFGVRLPRVLVVGSVGLLFLSFFLVWGGGALQRFTGLGQSGEGGRAAIQWDAWKMTMDVPLLGVGGGNFESLFPFYRETLQSEQRVLHPESDALWLGAEMGLPAVLIVGAAFAAVAGSMFPFAPRTDRHVRLACLVAGLMFVAHGFLDVSGHRIGTVLPALLLFAMGIPSRHEPLVFRKGLMAAGLSGALVLLLAGIVWVGQTLGWIGLPGRAARDFALEDAEQAIAAQEWVRAGLAVDAALASSPLSWQGHYQQGRLALAAGFPENQVRAAFLRARALDPNNPFISYRAGLLWWRNDRRDLALSCWNDALADARLHRGVVFNQIAQFLREIPGQEVRLAQMAARYPDLRVYALGMVSDEEYGPLAVQLAAGNPLGDAEAFTLFEGWERRRTEPDFEIFLGQHPEWMGQAWPLMARRLARQGDAEGALRILWERVPPPAWPQLDMSVPSIEAARLELRRNPLKIAQAYVVARDQEGGGRYEAALESIEPLLGTEGCPSYFYYLEAALRHSLGQGNEAYAALEKYRKMSKN